MEDTRGRDNAAEGLSRKAVRIIETRRESENDESPRRRQRRKNDGKEGRKEGRESL